MAFLSPQSKGLQAYCSRMIAAAVVLTCSSYVALAQDSVAPDPGTLSDSNSAYVNKLLQDGLSFGTAFERDVNRALSLNINQTAAPAPQYSFLKYAETYFESALSPQSLASDFAAGASSAELHGLIHDSVSTAEFERRFAEDMTRKSVAGSIDFITASLLQQDVRYRASGQHGIRNRAKYAFLQTFIAHGPAGDELAVSRIAASFGTAAVLDTWSPWMPRKERPNLMGQAGVIFGHYMARSFWNEFKPDIKHQIRSFLHRDDALTQP